MRYTDQTHEQLFDLLPDYATGKLDSISAKLFVAHSYHCEICTQELAEWRAIADAQHFSAAAITLPAKDFMRNVWAKIDAPSLQTEATWRKVIAHHWVVITAQIRIIPAATWIFSALGIILGTFCAALMYHPIETNAVLTYLIPLITATGIAFLYAPESDVGSEMTVATPTKERTVMISRFALLFAFDMLLTLSTTFILAQMRGENFWVITQIWLAPTTLLAAISFFATVISGPTVAAVGSLILWLSRTIHMGIGLTLQFDTRVFWFTPTQMWLVAIALFVAATVLPVSRERVLARQSV